MHLRTNPDEVGPETVRNSKLEWPPRHKKSRLYPQTHNWSLDNETTGTMSFPSGMMYMSKM